MTREKAIQVLCTIPLNISMPEIHDQMEAIKMAVSALRPVSREQVEMVWTGCDICGGDKKIKSDNFCGAATMRIVGDSIDLRGDEKKIKFFGHLVFL